MGPERLIRFAARASVLSLLVLAGACGRLSTPITGAPAPTASVRHVQVVHAMRTEGRRALVDRLRERNRDASGAEWTVNEEALAMSLAVVDPFAGFLRRARRQEKGKADVRAPVSEDQASAAARAFVKKNADLLGVPRSVVPGLDERVRNAAPSDHVSPRATRAVRFVASFPSRGYEGFRELDNVIDLEVFVDDDGEVSSFVNLSRVHPHLRIDTKPLIGSEDPRVVAGLVGRTVFALVGEEGEAKDPRELRRIPLGPVRAEDVRQLELVIHASAGPARAWLTYRLAYLVEIAKPAFPGEGDELAAPSPQYFFFRYVVDADTGEVIEDSRVPITASVPAP